MRLPLEGTLLEKLRKIEALHAGTKVDGEREAARRAAERIRARLSELQGREPETEYRYTLHDPWKRKLFLALCRRYGLKPYRDPVNFVDPTGLQSIPFQWWGPIAGGAAAGAGVGSAVAGIGAIPGAIVGAILVAAIISVPRDTAKRVATWPRAPVAESLRRTCRERLD